MVRAFRWLLIVLLALPAAPALVGCSDPGKPNPELKPPDVAPSERGSGKGPPDTKDKKRP